MKNEMNAMIVFRILLLLEQTPRTCLIPTRARTREVRSLAGRRMMTGSSLEEVEEEGWRWEEIPTTAVLQEGKSRSLEKQ